MRKFNTAGPVKEERHYCIPPLERLDLDDILTLVADERYFALHAPRQTGKTSCLLALRDLLNRSGQYRCVYANIEAAQAARHDVAAGMEAILSQLRIRARTTPLLNDAALAGLVSGALDDAGPHGALAEVLTRWAEADRERPLVVFLDEIDAVVGDTLISVLRQLRAGYDARPDHFPQSVALCGVRDVRDYRIHTGDGGEIIAGGSAFNVKAKSLRLGDFSQTEVQALLGLHTEETGQPFTDGASDAVWRQSLGQPWLVNALAYQTCFENRAGRDRSRPITADDVMEAREALIMSRQTHLHQLSDKLREGRVRRVIEPLLSGGEASTHTADDLEYVQDLGLIARDLPLRIANPIYAEVVPRELTMGKQAGLATKPAEWYLGSDGALDLPKLLGAFQVFFRENSEHWVERFAYREAGPQLLLQAFLQRIVNSGGRIEREYGLGRRRTDLLIVWPVDAGGRSGKDAGRLAEASRSPGSAAERGHAEGVPEGAGRLVRRYVVECKLLHKSLDRTIAEGLDQTIDYMVRCDAESGHLVIFDRSPGRAWDEKVFRREEVLRGRKVTVWGM